MQPPEDRHGGGRGRLGSQQHCRDPLLGRIDRPARLYPRINHHPEICYRFNRSLSSGSTRPINTQKVVDSVIDRDTRWGLFTLITGFCSVVIAIGVVVAIDSLKGKTKNHGSPRLSLTQMRQFWKDAQTNGEYSIKLSRLVSTAISRVAEKTDLAVKIFCGVKRVSPIPLEQTHLQVWERVSLSVLM